MRRLALLLPVLAGLLLACQPPLPPPASVTVKGLSDEGGPSIAPRIRVDGLIEAREWADADTVEVLLSDGRTITVLHQRGPGSLAFAFMGLGGNVARNIQPEILLDVSGDFPPQFGRDTWWFRNPPGRCIARGSIDDLSCGSSMAGFESSPAPIDRQDNLEVRIDFSLLELNPTATPVIAFALRFSEDPLLQDAVWPLDAELRRPDTWARLDLSR